MSEEKIDEPSVNQAAVVQAGTSDAYFTRPTTQIAAEQRLAAERGETPEDLEGKSYAVEGNDLSGYVGVDPAYMTYADDTHKPLQAEGDSVEAELEARALEAQATVGMGGAVTDPADVEQGQDGDGSQPGTLPTAAPGAGGEVTQGESVVNTGTDGEGSDSEPKPKAARGASKD